jgi:hypothetical protein
MVDEWMSMEHLWDNTDKVNWSTGRKTLHNVGGRWMNMEPWWNYTDRVNWRTGRKTWYSVGGRWMNEYWAMVELYWWGKLKYRKKNLSKWQWSPQISHGLLGLNVNLRGESSATDRLTHVTANVSIWCSYAAVSTRSSVKALTHSLTHLSAVAVSAARDSCWC